jgi:hypothetical protein
MPEAGEVKDRLEAAGRSGNRPISLGDPGAATFKFGLNF